MQCHTALEAVLAPRSLQQDKYSTEAMQNVRRQALVKML